MTLEEIREVRFTDLVKALDYLAVMMGYSNGGATYDVDAEPPRISLRFEDGNEILVGETEIFECADEWIRNDAFPEEWGDDGIDGLPRKHPIFGFWQYKMVNEITESKLTEKATVMELMNTLFTWVKG